MTSSDLVFEAHANFFSYSYRAFFNEALEGIPTLNPEERKKTEDIISDIKKKMKLQIMCLQVVN